MKFRCDCKHKDGKKMKETAEMTGDWTTPKPCDSDSTGMFFESNAFKGRLNITFMKRRFLKFRKKSFVPLMETVNDEFTQLMQPGLFEFFRKVRKDFGYRSISELPIRFDSPLQEKIFDLIDKCGITSPLHIFFTAVMIKSSSWEIKSLAPEKIVEIINNHISMFHRTKIDSVQKLSAFMNPFGFQLGVVIRDEMLSMEEIEFFAEDPSRLDLYGRLLAAGEKPNKLKKWRYLKDIDLGKSMSRYQNSSTVNFKIFKKLPFDNAVFQNRVLLMNVEEAAASCWLIPNDVSDETMKEMINKRVRDYRNESSSARRCGALVDASSSPNIDRMIKTLYKYEIEQKYHGMVYNVLNLCDLSGTRDFLEKYFRDNPEMSIDEVNTLIKNVTELRKSYLVKSIDQSMNSVEANFDYVLLKFMESFDVKTVLDTLNEVRVNDLAFTVREWFLIFDQHDEILRDVPVAWWLSLVTVG